MVRREVIGLGDYIPIITPISKVALFLAEIPSNLKRMMADETIDPFLVEDRFPNLSGFGGDTNEKEMYLLLSRYDSDIEESVVELVDLQSFDVLHTWNPDINSFWEKVDKIEGGKWEHLMRDGNDNRLIMVHPILIEDGSLLFQSNSPLIKIDKNSELEWMKDDEVYHHSNEEDNEGNFWVCVEYYPYKIDSMYVGNKYGNYNDDGLRKISSEGEILFDKSVSEIFIENNLKHLLFSIHGHELETDPIHINDIEPVNFDSEFWKKGDVFLSFGHQSMIMLYRPITNEVIWKISGDFFHQHDIDILDSKRISIFNNNRIYTKSGSIVEGNNEILIYDFEKQKMTSYLRESLIEYDVRTIGEGLHEIFPNGNLFLEEPNYGRLLYFNSDGSLRWTHVNRGNNGNVYRLGWSRILYEDEDIEKVNRFLKIKNEIAHNE